MKPSAISVDGNESLLEVLKPKSVSDEFLANLSAGTEDRGSIGEKAKKPENLLDFRSLCPKIGAKNQIPISFEITGLCLVSKLVSVGKLNFTEF